MDILLDATGNDSEPRPMRNLFIMGNGFDIAHGLNTSYANFREWLDIMTEISDSDEVTTEFIEALEIAKTRITERNNAIYSLIEKEPLEEVKRRLALLVAMANDLTQITNTANFDDLDDNLLQKITASNTYTRELLAASNITQSPVTRDFFLKNPELSSNMINFVNLIFEMDSAIQNREYVLFPVPFVAFFLISLIDEITNGEWRNFEQALGSIEFDKFTKLFLGDAWEKILGRDAPIILREFIPGMLVTISLLFQSWIKEIKLDSINPKDDFKKLFSPDDCYFSTNYTCTLEKVYNIHNVCHIHGAVDDSGSQRLIIGHGTGNIDNYSDDISKIDIFIRNNLKKPVGRCIAYCQDFFNSLVNINKIFSFGFSFSDVDIPYISKICDCIGDTSGIIWFLSDYNLPEHEVLKNKIAKSGFRGKFDVFHIS